MTNSLTGRDKNSGTTTLTPGEFLKRRMALSGLSATALAKELGVHVQTIYNVTTGTRPISSSLALKLSKRLNGSADLWLQKKMDVNLSEIDDALTIKRARNSVQAADNESGPLFSQKDIATKVDRLLVDRDIISLIGADSEHVRITPYKQEQVQPASYDLTVGIIIEEGFEELSEHEWVLVLKRAYEPDDAHTREATYIDEILKKKGAKVRWSKAVDLEKHQSVVVIAREMVSFKKEYLAEVGSTATNAMRGLLVNHGFQIDPGYSGPIIVTAMNIGIHGFELAAGEKIVSLAIRKLAKAPDHAYRADTQEKIVALFNRVDHEIKKLFACRRLADGKEYAAEAKDFDQSHVGMDEDDALNKAVRATVEALSRPLTDNPAYPALDAAVRDVLNSVSIDKNEAKALVRHFAITDEKLKGNAMRFFEHVGDRQTLAATLERLDQDPIVAYLAQADEQ